MQKHNYWGKISKDKWEDFLSEVKFISKYFPNKEIIVFLGKRYNKYLDKTNIPPNSEELDNFENTYTSFLHNLDKVMEEIKEKTFEDYQEYYADFYENEEQSGKKSLHIKNKEQHFQYMQDVLCLRILPKNNIIISIRYDLDTEHGIEIRLENNKVIRIGGISDT